MSSQIQEQEKQAEISFEELQVLAQTSPSGLAWVANLKGPKRDPLDPYPEHPSRWIHAQHVDYLDEILVNLVAGTYRNEGYVGVIVMEPPRHGKSELCSHYFPAWYLGARPDNKLILCSYEADFARSWGGKVRDTLTKFGPELYGVTVDKKSAAMDDWTVQNRRGGMITAGVGGAITGRGGDLLIIDDPVKNSQDAASETVRNKQKEWYRSTFRTRLEPDGVILVIGTRWHEDDLLGYLIQRMEEDEDADQFIIVRLPAIAESPSPEYPSPDPLGRQEGEVLFPERWPMRKLTQHMSNPYTWAALYQQRPAPKEGNLFSEGDFEIVNKPDLPTMKRTVRFWDLAGTDPKKGEDPDWTAGLKMGMGTDGYYYVLDLVHERKDVAKMTPVFRAVCRSDGLRVRQRIEQEPGSAGKYAVHHLRRGPFTGYPTKGVRETGSKEVRADVVAEEASQGGIRVLKGDWNRAFFKELVGFPNAAHDDIVDAFSGAYAELSRRGRRGVTTF